MVEKYMITEVNRTKILCKKLYTICAQNRVKVPALDTACQWVVVTDVYEVRARPPNIHVLFAACPHAFHTPEMLSNPNPWVIANLRIKTPLDIGDGRTQIAIYSAFFLNFIDRMNGSSVVFAAEFTGDLGKAEM